MLDLDALAERRADTLQQDRAGWVKAVWSGPFQQINQNMSDGEVESLIALCPSAQAFESVVRFLASGATAHEAPYSRLESEAKSAGLSVDEWVRRL